MEVAYICDLCSLKENGKCHETFSLYDCVMEFEETDKIPSSVFAEETFQSVPGLNMKIKSGKIRAFRNTENRRNGWLISRSWIEKEIGGV